MNDVWCRDMPPARNGYQQNYQPFLQNQDISAQNVVYSAPEYFIRGDTVTSPPRATYETWSPYFSGILAIYFDSLVDCFQLTTIQKVRHKVTRRFTCRLTTGSLLTISRSILTCHGGFFEPIFFIIGNSNVKASPRMQLLNPGTSGVDPRMYTTRHPGETASRFEPCS